MADTIKKQFNSKIKALNVEVVLLSAITEHLSLLSVVHKVARQVDNSIKELKQLSKGLEGDALLHALQDSEAFVLLDELVDEDVMSELEEHVLFSVEGLQDRAIGQFIDQLMLKIEVRYARMVDKIHALNAFLESDMLD